jgi:hypothetical protein
MTYIFTKIVKYLNNGFVLSIELVLDRVKLTNYRKNRKEYIFYYLFM